MSKKNNIEILKFKGDLWEVIRLTSCEIEQVVKPIVEFVGLTPVQANILYCIEQGKIHTVGSLAQSLSINQGNASTMCKKLEYLGYIKRCRSIEDERVVNLQLTQEGKEVLKNIEKLLENKALPVLKEFPKEDMKDIIKGFKKFKELVEKLSINN